MAFLAIAFSAWGKELEGSYISRNTVYRCYAVLTMARMLYTLHHGTIVTQPVAARWAQDSLDGRWTPLIRDALAWSSDRSPDLELTLACIRHTCEYAHPQ